MEGQRAENTELDHEVAGGYRANRRGDGMKTGGRRWKGIIGAPGPHQAPGAFMPTILARLSIHMTRNVIRSSSAARVALLALLVPACSEPADPGTVRVSVTRFAATDGQTGQVGMALPEPLK